MRPILHTEMRPNMLLTKHWRLPRTTHAARKRIHSHHGASSDFLPHCFSVLDHIRSVANDVASCMFCAVRSGPTGVWRVGSLSGVAEIYAPVLLSSGCVAATANDEKYCWR